MFVSLFVSSMCARVRVRVRVVVKKIVWTFPSSNMRAEARMRFSLTGGVAKHRTSLVTFSFTPHGISLQTGAPPEVGGLVPRYLL